MSRRDLIIIISAIAIGICLVSIGIVNWRRAGSPRTGPESVSPPIDTIVENALVELGVPEDHIRSVVEGNTRRIKARIPGDLPLVVCNLEISRSVSQFGAKVADAAEYPRKKIVEMRIIRKGSKTPLEVTLISDPSYRRKTGKIAIIIDDFGYRSLELAQGFCDIEQPITLSIFPDLQASKKIAEMAHRSGHEVMVHLPMEPWSYPENDPGPGAIFVNLSNSEISARTRRALRSVPYAVGVNNHMGSKATEDMRVMKQVVREVKRMGMFFVDSRTSSRSIAYTVARYNGVRAARSDMFLDSENDPVSIERSLWRLAEKAAEKGRAIGIGHNRPNTLEVLRRVLPRLEKRGFNFVYVSEMLD